MIDKNAHVNVIYSLEQVNYISFGVGLFIIELWVFGDTSEQIIFNVPTLLFCITASREH